MFILIDGQTDKFVVKCFESVKWKGALIFGVNLILYKFYVIKYKYTQLNFFFQLLFVDQ